MKTYDKGTAETKAAYVDLQEGVLFYKGEQVGNPNAYMSIGVEEIESAVSIKSSNEVYIVDSNPACITTVTQTKKFVPTQSAPVVAEESPAARLVTHLTPYIWHLIYPHQAG